MTDGRVRPIAIAVIKRGDDILVFEGYDPGKLEVFYRPLGGGIEFGEYGDQALRREMIEELGVELGQVRYLGALENIYNYDGRLGHEIVQVYEAMPADPSLYEREHMTGYEDNGTQFHVMWKPLAGFLAGEAPLYPDGLLEMLTGQKPSG
ncbi:MAG TPA: NUDIX hydrolase [Chloroflexota bacterium]